jgi:transposase InsO family protein
VCAAFVEALQRFGIPDEVLTDNGKFTGRFNRPRPGEVMFERICRENGIVARNTKPRTPTTTGKVEWFHQTLQRELLDDVAVWPDLEAAQAAIEAFRIDYNTNRPHQSLDMAFPADRFTPRPNDERLPLRLPPVLAANAAAVPGPRPEPLNECLRSSGYAVRVVASGGGWSSIVVECLASVATPPTSPTPSGC